MPFNKILFIILKVQASYAAKLDPHLGVAYQLARSDLLYNSFRKLISGSPKIKKIYNKIRK